MTPDAKEERSRTSTPITPACAGPSAAGPTMANASQLRVPTMHAPDDWSIQPRRILSSRVKRRHFHPRVHAFGREIAPIGCIFGRTETVGRAPCGTPQEIQITDRLH